MMLLRGTIVHTPRLGRLEILEDHIIGRHRECCPLLSSLEKAALTHHSFRYYYPFLLLFMQYFSENWTVMGLSRFWHL